MSLSFTDERLIVPDRVLTRVVDSSLVLLDTATGNSFLLDGVGARVWTVLTGSTSLQAGYEQLLAEYHVEQHALERDLTSLIESLESRGLLEVQRG